MYVLQREGTLRRQDPQCPQTLQTLQTLQTSTAAALVVTRRDGEQETRADILLTCTVVPWRTDALSLTADSAQTPHICRPESAAVMGFQKRSLMAFFKGVLSRTVRSSPVQSGPVPPSADARAGDNGVLPAIETQL